MARARYQGHEDLSRGDEPRAGSSDRTFGFVFAGVLTLLALLPLLNRRSPRWWWLGPAAAFAVVALTHPALLRPLNRVWTWLGLALHAVTSPIVLGLLFFGTIVPTGLVLRLMKKDLLRLRLDPNATTYWIERRPPGPAPDTMRNQF
jgi:Saxitoxin biosynthesis operon protein SxtJ